MRPVHAWETPQAKERRQLAMLLLMAYGGGEPPLPRCRVGPTDSLSVLQTIDSGAHLSSEAHSFPGRQLLTKPSWRSTSDLDVRALQGPDLPPDALTRLPEVAESRQVGRAALVCAVSCRFYRGTLKTLLPIM